VKEAQMTGRETDLELDVVWLDDVGLDDVAQAGGKGANLGDLIGAGLHVPSGFVVTASAYRQAAEAAGVRDRLTTLRGSGTVDDPDDPDDPDDRAAGDRQRTDHEVERAERGRRPRRLLLRGRDAGRAAPGGGGRRRLPTHGPPPSSNS
jgi:hypothetical protein